MFRVVYFDEAVWDDEVDFEGSLEECREFVREERKRLEIDNDDYFRIIDENYDEY